MAGSSYQIVCVTTEHPHRHILSVGIGGTAAAPGERLTVGTVRDRLGNGDSFYTVSPSTTKIAFVRKATCRRPKCKVKTIRSVDDAVQDNNLDNLAVCPQ